MNKIVFKRVTTFIVLVYLKMACVAQALHADAGYDTLICQTVNPLDSLLLGGAPTAEFGVPPYAYRWTIDPYIYPQFPQLNQYASDLLSDTSVANPLYILSAIDTTHQVFYLEVTDSLGGVAHDTVTVQTCGYSVVPLGNTAIYPTVGDTVSYACGSSYKCGIDSVRWQPHPNIVSSTGGYSIEVLIDDTNFKLSELTLDIYTSDGCVAVADYCDPIIPAIYPLGASEIRRQEVSVFPNPSDGNFQIRSVEPIVSIEVLDLNGRHVSIVREGEAFQIHSPGIYLALVHTDTDSTHHRLVVLD